MGVLIVGKTRMKDKICIGAIDLSNKKSLRLLTQSGENHQPETPFEIGQVWEMEYLPIASPRLPHVEDVLIQDCQLTTTITALRDTLLNFITPWQGALQNTFDGKLQATSNGNRYIAQKSGLPSCSTGFWLPEQPLCQRIISSRIRYCYPDDASEAFDVPYVGIAQMPHVIQPSSLVRLSLARWWKRNEKDEERCYLQLSGWYS
jgi:hypothetical protein